MKHPVSGKRISKEMEKEMVKKQIQLLRDSVDRIDYDLSQVKAVKSKVALTHLLSGERGRLTEAENHLFKLKQELGEDS